MTAGLVMNFAEDTIKNVCFSELEIMQKIKSQLCYFCEEKLGMNHECLHCISVQEAFMTTKLF